MFTKKAKSQVSPNAIDDGGDSPAEKVPDKVAKGIDKVWRPVPANQPAQEVKSKADAVSEVTGDLQTGLLQDDQFDALASGVDGFEGLLRLRMGIRRGVASQGHADHSETKLLPAVDQLQKAQGLLLQKAPEVLTDIDMDQVAQDRQRVEQLGQLKEPLQQLVKDIDAEMTHPEKRLEGTLRTIHTRTDPLKTPGSPLIKGLALVADYTAGSAQQGAQTRVATDKARAEGGQTTLDWVNQNQNAAGGTTAPPPGTTITTTTTGGTHQPAGGPGVGTVGVPVKQGGQAPAPTHAPPGRSKRKRGTTTT